jgi:hypothetical protein
MWDLIKWILIICLGPEVLALALRVLALIAIPTAAWLSKWPLSPF